MLVLWKSYEWVQRGMGIFFLVAGYIPLVNRVL
jgi:hypothetical protein